MRWADVAKKVLALAEVVHRWLAAVSKLEPERKARVARYADAIADTLARTAELLGELEAGKIDPKTHRQAIRELARVRGYVATIVDVLEHQLDGRRLAGVKRRLETLDCGQVGEFDEAAPGAQNPRIERLYAAEGYFRALSDGLRV
ncbi:MAG: hypothetical protein K0U74_01290 [Alphaproteobacteria bacterium]|nr:hypothetical protein [Alphaproteobacteria bacterium]